MRIVATEYVTLDGIMGDPGGGEGSEHGGWSFQYWNDEAAKFKSDELFASDALLLGRVTYQGFAAAWPTMEGTGDFGVRMNSLPKYVVSTTLTEVAWKNSHLIQQNVSDEIAKLQQQPGQDLLLSGSAQLVQSLMAADLIDEYRLMVHPIVLGGGKRLFSANGALQKLKLTDTKTFSSGIVVLSYAPDRAE